MVALKRIKKARPEIILWRYAINVSNKCSVCALSTTYDASADSKQKSNGASRGDTKFAAAICLNLHALYVFILY